VDEVRELGSIAEEENGSVVGDNVPVALVGPELDGESSWVAGTVMGTRFATNCGETYGDWHLLSGLEHVGAGKIIHSIRGLVVSMGTAALCVHNTLWNALAVEVGKEIDQVEVLEEERSILAGSLTLVRMRNRRAIAGSVDSLLRGSVAVGFVRARFDSGGCHFV
jgi:hypothetical protein